MAKADSTQPSLFHSRLFLLAAGMLLVVIVLFTQHTRLAVVEGAEHRTEAESVLDRRAYLPTYRGRILDRHGRVLAVDRASYQVAVKYDVIASGWAERRAAHAAAASHPRTWKTLTFEEQQQLIEQRLPEYQAAESRLWNAIKRHGELTDEELNEKRTAIVSRIHHMAAAVAAAQRERELEELGGRALEEINRKPRPIREQTIAHPILDEVSDEIAFEFLQMAERLPDAGDRRRSPLLEVIDSRQRVYPWSEQEVVLDRGSLPKPLRSEKTVVIPVRGVADHLLGAMREQVYDDDMNRRPFRDAATGTLDRGGYLVGDWVGSRGIEARFEDWLRGERGVIDERKDTLEQWRIDPQPGNDVQLTLDIILQARVQAILSPAFGLTRVQAWHGDDNVLPNGYALNSAAVIIEVETGDILAMVTSPTLADAGHMAPSEQAEREVAANRAVEAIYPPGSIIKPLVLAAAVREGVYSFDEAIQCTGHYFENVLDSARCWIYREDYSFQTHTALRADEAIARSCNIFFYTLADRLGFDRIHDWYAFFGIGRTLDIGIGVRNEKGHMVGESPGALVNDRRIEIAKKEGYEKSLLVGAGIGQSVAWTPMHAANAFATLARGGVVRDANLIETPDPVRSQRTPDRPLPETLVKTALEGLRQSVAETYGTGNHITYAQTNEREPIINAKGVTVWAKTGTAQAPLMPKDLDGDGELTPDERKQGIPHLDHSWFVGLVGPEGGEPLYAIAVIAEFAGSGGRVSGPIINQIIHALQHEGYLPGGER